MLSIPLQAIPNQAVAVALAGQSCTLKVFQKSTALFMDVFLPEGPVVVGVICQNRNRIVRDSYLGLIGDFIFIDQQGSDDPIYTGLGTRFILNYLEASDLEAAANGQ